MMNEKMVAPLRIAILAEMKKRRYIGILKSDDIINDMCIDFKDTDFTLQDYINKINRYLLKEEVLDRTFNLSPEIKSENSKNASSSTKYRRATDPDYKAKHNKQKCDWEKKEKKTNPIYRLKRLAAQVATRLFYNTRRKSSEWQKCQLADEGKCIRQLVNVQYQSSPECPLQHKYTLKRGKCCPK